jgi:hypothetical protein
MHYQTCSIMGQHSYCIALSCGIAALTWLTATCRTHSIAVAHLAMPEPQHSHHNDRSSSSVAQSGLTAHGRNCLPWTSLRPAQFQAALAAVVEKDRTGSAPLASENTTISYSWVVTSTVPGLTHTDYGGLWHSQRQARLSHGYAPPP